MSDYRVASRYARSLLDLSIEQKIEDKIKDDMQLIADTCNENRNLVVSLKNPIIKYDKKINILKSLFGKKVNPLVIRFIELISRKNRAEILPEIAGTWIELYNEHKNILHAKIASAISLTEAEKKKILTAIEADKKKKVILDETIDKDLIGGFVLNIKDQRLDNSVAGQLKQLKRKFLNRA